MSIKLVLVSPESENRNTYARAIEAIGVPYDTVATFKELYHAMEKIPYNGILIDLAAKMKASHDDLGIVESILEKFPVLYLKWEDHAKVVKTYYPGQHALGGNLEDFINKQCRFFDSRRISTEKRLGIHFSVLLSKDGAFREENVERTITINVSEGGCFIFTNQEWEVRSDVWFVVKGINDETPIRGEVRWFFRWGICAQNPGIGVKFQQIKESQIREMCCATSLEEQRRRRKR